MVQNITHKQTYAVRYLKRKENMQKSIEREKQERARKIPLTIRGPNILPAVRGRHVLEDLEPDGTGAVELGGLPGGLGHVGREGARVVDGRSGREGDLATGLGGSGRRSSRAGTIIAHIPRSEVSDQSLGFSLTQDDLKKKIP